MIRIEHRARYVNDSSCPRRRRLACLYNERACTSIAFIVGQLFRQDIHLPFSSFGFSGDCSLAAIRSFSLTVFTFPWGFFLSDVGPLQLFRAKRGGQQADTGAIVGQNRQAGRATWSRADDGGTDDW